MCSIRHQSRRLLKEIIKQDGLTEDYCFLEQPELQALKLRNPFAVAQYLEGRGLITIRRTLDGTTFVQPTPQGRAFLPDEAAKRWHTVWHDVLLPIAIAAITALVTMWITGYFDKGAASTPPIP